MRTRHSILAALLWIACSAPAFAESVALFRVFLNDGTAVVSYGEYARVGDRLVFSMPMGAVDPGQGGHPVLHVVNLPSSSVNWIATTKYAESARYSHYMATRAESDYSALAGEVAATLNAIIVAKDAKTRLGMAVEARRRLATWPSDHYGYRADDVQEMLGLLDEAIAGLRVAAGETSFAIDLVATDPPRVERREDVPLLHAPSESDAITHAVAVAKATDISTDRVSILRGVIASLDKHRESFPKRWAEATRKSALRTIEEEARLGREYAELTADVLERATEAARSANVRDAEKVVEEAARKDAQLGHGRQNEMQALLERLRSELDAARGLRLARDRWHERTRSYRAYSKVVEPIMDTLADQQRHLDDIKRLAGSNKDVLADLGKRLAKSTKTLGIVSVPAELKPAHELLLNAVGLADAAVSARRRATLSGLMADAWNASAAAAGSMKLLERAREDIEAAVRFPETR